MVKTSRGLRTGTRRKLAKALRSKFKPRPFIREFKPNDKVIIMIEPSSQRGMPFPRFKGSVGYVKEKTKWGYVVRVRLGNKEKLLTVRPEHLKAPNMK